MPPTTPPNRLKHLSDEYGTVLTFETKLERDHESVKRESKVLTRADFGAEPFLDAVLVNILQAACTPAWLDKWIRVRGLSHLTDSAKISLILVRVLQQQAIEENKTNRKKKNCACLTNYN